MYTYLSLKGVMKEWAKTVNLLVSGPIQVVYFALSREETK